ncbi:MULTISPECIES: peptidyl-prolyl cis-trans isomerase [unclassified Sulfitobacter]|uniref:peptidyl-prolyl cis-trans isomerase n=1 Tax=unclassified Sulfitobacter TaxID=196795 RepID=UPI0023E09CEF|nr:MULTISPECIES: peptidyl-prolyl cis-trans isomerase [unclassified Sulfitobacter]MDF3382699.1 peptidylprolyl isomerase [Sulfitobacter sp. Ks11]MDF3386118.1 peptidylprolyl isomerase [Sulfitobacter sp. M85]MDF3389537.1 peptidylprolyl isomerase [Sulfitobacter sp. Ks16]MDF3400174.1 peptidylprolyl isomerase [Sulfitobacter sp. KE39]MDF3403595.1 peptidylprolyl isomerase [Sulfitobacter sp. Ks35]
MAKKGFSFSKTAVWALMALLILGLGGFGAINLSGNLRSIGTVGDKSISVDQYARQLQQEIRAIEAQTGESLPFARAQEMGLDRAVLQRIVRNRALDHEADEMGISIGDATLRDEIVAISAFQGIDGNFDREGYRFALQQSGMSEAEFERSIREEAARGLLQRAILGGVSMPDTYARTLVDYVAEERSFTWARLSEDDLDAPLPAATEDELRAYYDANTDDFMLPASKSITYAWLAPEDLLDEVEVPEEELRAEYDARSDEYDQPERRLVERLVFADQEAADRAAAALEVDGTTFEALVEERGLALADVDLGDVAKSDLDDAADAVFSAESGDIVGPLPSSLGPALFRVNAILPAQHVPFEEAREVLEETLAISRATRAVEARAQEVDDQLAGGATLEDLAQETKMRLGTIDWTQDSSEGIAAYGAFREAAAGLSANDFPQIDQLEDGGVFAMRLDETKEARPEPFEEARDAVETAWRNAQVVEALTEKAESLTETLGEEGGFEAAGLTPQLGEGLTRSSYVDGTPDDFMDQVFDLDEGGVAVLPAGDSVVVLRLDAVTPAGEDDQTQALMDRLSQQLDQALAQGLFDIYSNAVMRDADPQIDQRAVNAVHVNFP